MKFVNVLVLLSLLLESGKGLLLTPFGNGKKREAMASGQSSQQPENSTAEAQEEIIRQSRLTTKAHEEMIRLAESELSKERALNEKAQLITKAQEETIHIMESELSKERALNEKLQNIVHSRVSGEEASSHSHRQNQQVNHTWKQIDFYLGPDSMVGKKLEEHSQCGQDWLVSSLLGCKSNGYFVDLAANDATKLSNTLMLERDFDWRGICIEANAEYLYGLSHRKCEVVVGAVGSPSNQEVVFKLNNVYGGIIGKEYDNKEAGGAPTAKLETISLDELLDTLHAPSTIDYLSLDVEGAESLVMNGFPWTKYTIYVITVERPKADLQSWLVKAGYSKLRTNSNWNDQTWVHKSLPDFDHIMQAWANHAGKPLPASCMDSRGYRVPDIMP